MKAIITVGISASGKSTWARQQKGFAVLERDIYRRGILHENIEIDDSMNLWSVWKFNKENEKNVTDRYNKDLETFIEIQKDIILADTNLQEKYRKPLIKKLEDAGYEVEIKYFPITLEEAWKRDEKRRDTVGREVIYKQYKQYLETTNRKRYTPKTSKPECIIVDIDGTLAHMNGKRGPFEWDKVDMDDCDESVKLICNLIYLNCNLRNIHVILLSGRDGCCLKETKDWLQDNWIPYRKFFIRDAGDMRKDTIIKEEIFWNHIADNYNVLFAIDDRPSVCRMWRELGIKVFQVGDPHEEF